MTLVPLDRARLEAALEALAERDREVEAALARLGPPEPRVREPGFATLLRIVVAQQLSTKAAAAIWARLERAMGGACRPEAFLALGEAELRAAGLSARKIAYGRGLAEAVLDGRLPVDELHRLDDEEVVARITALSGFGRWSAEIYLLFALGRVDAFPADDLGLQAGFQRLKGLERRPSGRALRELVAHWAPWRGAGALLLWRVHGAATLEPATAGLRPPPAP
jgi:DNA-3-methyladenine glycosylase II